ncbi:MAG: hypothetical protein ACRBDX_09455 [Gammaproteobacteria bacterium]
MRISKDNFFKNFMLGVTGEPISADSRQLNHDAILKLVSAAQNQIAIISRYLDPTIFSKEDFIQSASEFIRRTKTSNIRILVHDTDPMVKYNHRILSLSQRVSSKIQIRTICNDYSQFNQSYLVADSVGYIHNLKGDLYDAEINFNDSDKSNELMETFKSIWELSQQEAEVRRLCI